MINYSRQGSIRVDVDLLVPYQIDLKQLKPALEKAITDQPLTFGHPESGVFVSELAFNYVKVIVR